MSVAQQFLQPMLGGAVAWTPASATTNGGVLPHTWLYPDAGLFQDSGLTTPAVADGDPVGGWTNQGSDAYSVTQATGANKPTLKLNIKNGQPILRFDGGDWLQGAFSGGIITQPNSYFLVAKLADAAVNDNLYHAIVGGDDSARRIYVYQRGLNVPDAWSVFAGAELVGGASDGNWNVWTILANGGSSQFWLNGISEATGNIGNQGLDGLTVGAQFNFLNQWIGDTAEILFYSVNLSDADKNQVGQYFASKYAITYTDI